MAMTKTINDKEFGDIKLAKYKKSKNLRIKINQNSEVTLTMPYFVSFDTALEFLQEKRSWLKNEIGKIKLEKEQLKFTRPNAVIEIPETKDLEQITHAIDTDYKTKFHDLELIPCDLNKASFRISTNKIKIYYPKELSSKHEHVKGIIDEALRTTLRKEAKVYLPRRLREFSLKHDLRYKSLSLRDTKTRWGSCTVDNKISLCIHLMKLPDELIDYVLLHELAHIKQKNHSKAFWDLLTELLGEDSKKLDAKLKNYSTEIILL
jgi:predicted metal-dependent hydrolase